MPLVSYRNLPTYERLRGEGHTILSPGRAAEQDIRPLHVGLLNMMPDAALQATERQFFRLVGSSNPIAQFHMHPFTLDSISRSAKARAHIESYYEPWKELQERGLDALIISGANVTQPDLALEVFWDDLSEVIAWAENNVTSTLCSCLATHSVLLARYDIARQRLSSKCWGVFEHEVIRRDHPLVSQLNTQQSVPHSRFNDVSRQQMEAKGLHVLIEGEKPGVQLAVSPDGFRTVFFQGHPEYDEISLMKEYKRELAQFFNGTRSDYPPVPEHYFDAHVLAILDEYREQLEIAKAKGTMPPEFPEYLIRPRLHNTWHDSGEALVGNWIGLVYQLTHAQRELPFMEGVNPDDPLNWL
ncbi:MAG: homoserine O-succinyltransferase, partial [Gammaproteobacteria bacterium]|nr:homoserine O-succinyltransferase [Gammaproteobacteria bacterium]